MPPTLTRADLEAALPDVTSTLRTTGLIEPVTIVRDGFGIPHVRAGNEHDAFFAQGFATAQDRLWHMDYDRHRALGRWAEFAGTSALTEDRLMRRFGVERAARADLEVSSAAAQAMLTAYADGVNAFLDTTATLPVEYRLLDARPERWEPWHCLAVYKVRNMLMGTFEMKLWRARLALALGPERAAPLFRGYPDDGLVSVPPGETYGGVPLEALDDLAAAVAELNWLGEVDGGSNAWVVSGERSATGRPLVAGDSHRALDTPNVYYQVHLTCPEFRCSGYALPGFPGMPHFSHTDHVAWGMTHGFGDYQDLFIERFRAGDGAGNLEYLYREAWTPAEVTEERIAVRGGADETLRVVRTRHGPVVAGDPDAGHGLAFSHTGTQSGTPWPDAVHGLLHARSADAAEAALREWTEPVNNFVYADTAGEFGYRYRGRIPLRPMANGWAPVPGWTGANEWDGQIPFEALPHARNPQAGFVVTCNNAPTGADYPYYINTYFAADWRARRITARLEALPAGSADVDQMTSVHADRTSIPAQGFVRRVADLRPTNPRLAEACAMLADWDCGMDRASAAAAIYGAARSYLFRDVVAAQLGPLADAAIGAADALGRGGAAHAGQIFARALAAMAQDDPALLPAGATWASAIESALTRAIDELTERLGDDMQSWTWGAVHHTRPKHPLARVFPEMAALLDPPGIATHGDGDTPLAGAYSSVDRLVATLMSVNRYVHDPSDWRRSRWIVPLGASGHPGSPHYADQAALWADVETTAQLWDWDDIEAAAESRQTLTP